MTQTLDALDPEWTPSFSPSERVGCANLHLDLNKQEWAAWDRFGRVRNLDRIVKLAFVEDAGSVESSYRGLRFPPKIISDAVWLSHRFTLSFRDVKDLLAERVVTEAFEAIGLWCLRFGPTFARYLLRRHGRLGDVWHVDKVFVTTRGQRHYLWTAVDQDGNVLDIPVTRRRHAIVANRFIRKLLKA